MDTAEATNGLAGRLSLNQITADPYDMRAVIAACAANDVPRIALWRHKVEELGVAATAELLREAGVGVSSLCRGGFFAARTAQEREARHADNVRALEEAAALGAEILVLVCGPAPDRDLDTARRQVREGIEALVPHAQRVGVKLGIEALHPMYAGDRSVIVTLAQANAMAEELPRDVVGIVVDAFHVWWDPCVYEEIERATGRIVGFHVSDWIVPVPDLLMGRGMMGDGIIELRRLRDAVDATGYRGPIEVEIFNRDVWAMPLDDLVGLVRTRFLQVV